MAKRYTSEDLKQIQKQLEDLVLNEDKQFLLVDRQISARRALLNALVSAGVDKALIHEANDAMDAMMHLGKNAAPHVVLTELKLPDMEAPELVEHLRAKEGGEKHVFILVTAEKSKKKLALALQAGMAGYIAKPPKPDEVAATLKKCDAL